MSSALAPWRLDLCCAFGTHRLPPKTLGHNCRWLSDISLELLKCAKEPISITLHILLTKFWRDAIIISLYKGKGSKSDCTSYWSISLLSVPGKVFAHAILGRPVLHWQQHPQQSVFTAGRSTANECYSCFAASVGVVRKIFKASACGLRGHMDINAAFDSVDREALWKALQAKHVPPYLHTLNEVMCPSWQELHSLVPYIFRISIRLCPGCG